MTIADRLQPPDQDYGLHRTVYWAITELPFGQWLRRRVVDPRLFRDNPVTWRNYEASYDVAELEPSSRRSSTYVLQEYFVPVDSLQPFVAAMGRILTAHDVNVVNISIRHALPDTGTLLAWAPRETFAFVLYYKQGTSETARARVAT